MKHLFHTELGVRVKVLDMDAYLSGYGVVRCRRLEDGAELRVNARELTPIAPESKSYIPPTIIVATRRPRLKAPPSRSGGASRTGDVNFNLNGEGVKKLNNIKIGPFTVEAGSLQQSEFQTAAAANGALTKAFENIGLTLTRELGCKVPENWTIPVEAFGRNLTIQPKVHAAV